MGQSLDDLVETIIVFDMDGVIIDSLPALYNAYQAFLGHFGKEGSREEFKTFNGPKIPEIVEILKEKYGLEGDSQDLLDFYNHCIDEACQEVPLVPGALELITELHGQGKTLAIASSALRQYVDHVLETHGIKSYFTHIVSGDDVTVAKPDPAIYLLVREHFGDKDYIVIEDAEKGVHAALGAGMRVIHYSHDPVEDTRVTPARTMAEVAAKVYKMAA